MALSLGTVGAKDTRSWEVATSGVVWDCPEPEGRGGAFATCLETDGEVDDATSIGWDADNPSLDSSSTLWA